MNAKPHAPNQSPKSNEELFSGMNSQMTHSQILQLQSMIGNSAVTQMLQSGQPENRTGLPDQLKTGIENLSGIAMDDVKVHYNSPKPEQIEAHAYAMGTDIHVGAGQEKHLPHEAWHVVQQKQGKVRPTLQAKGKSINDDSMLEQEADRMGELAVSGQTKAAQPLSVQSVAPAAGVIQGKWIKDANGKIKEVSDRYRLKRGERIVDDPDEGLADDEREDDENEGTESEDDEAVQETKETKVRRKELAKEHSKFMKAPDDYVAKALDYSSSEEDLSAGSEDIANDFERLTSVKESIKSEEVKHLKDLSDRLGKERKRGGSISQGTFADIGAMHRDRPGVVSVRDNRILHAAHRDIVPLADTKKKKVPIPYSAYRKRFNTAVPKAIERIAEHNGPGFKERVMRRLSPKSKGELTKWLKSGKVDLSNSDGKSAALEHKINKGGKFGYPDGQVRSRNLSLVNDDRKDHKGPHALMHSIKGAEGSGKTNYSALDAHAAGAVAAGIVLGQKRRRSDSDTAESSSDSDSDTTESSSDSDSDSKQPPPKRKPPKRARPRGSDDSGND
ncbi:DUF4157 domain-containing protein [Cohnella cholangitidis]|uniref:DUF4157 domain-containing protein n=2 Tax=Cohnella cholangitidis TaxID=2598458 RepID=A0A7G5C765_9BACL|nr:DUF4157 domain-containing protein [Cohnella cholangitidis]